MVTYKNEIFSSRNNSFTLGQVEDKMVYEWVKTGELSFKDFSQYLDDVRSNSYYDGNENGHMSGLVSGGY